MGGDCGSQKAFGNQCLETFLVVTVWGGGRGEEDSATGI